MKMDLITTLKKTAGPVAVFVAGIMACANADAAGQAKFLYTLDLANGAVKSYSINLASGAVKLQLPVRAVSDTPFSLAGTANGKFIYGSTRSSDILTFATNTNGQLPPVDDILPTFSVGLGVWQTVLHPNNKFAYALGTAYDITPLLVDQATGALNSNGDGAVVATGVGPHATIEPTGRFLYAAAGGLGFISDPSNTDNLWAYSINQTNGALSRIGKPLALPAFSHPVAIAAAPNGSFIAITDVADAEHVSLKDIRTYRIGSSGALTAGDPISASGNNNVAVQIDPTSQFVFVSSVSLTAGGRVIAYSVDPMSGALGKKVSEVVLASTETPGPMAMDPSGKFLFVLIRKETSRAKATFDTFLAAYTVSTAGALAQSTRTTIEHDTGLAHSSLIDLVLGQKTP